MVNGISTRRSSMITVAARENVHLSITDGTPCRPRNSFIVWGGSLAAHPKHGIFPSVYQTSFRSTHFGQQVKLYVQSYLPPPCESARSRSSLEDAGLDGVCGVESASASARLGLVVDVRLRLKLFAYPSEFRALSIFSSSFLHELCSTAR